MLDVSSPHQVLVPAGLAVVEQALKVSALISTSMVSQLEESVVVDSVLASVLPAHSCLSLESGSLLSMCRVSAFA